MIQLTGNLQSAHISPKCCGRSRKRPTGSPRSSNAPSLLIVILLLLLQQVSSSSSPDACPSSSLNQIDSEALRSFSQLLKQMQPLQELYNVVCAGGTEAWPSVHDELMALSQIARSKVFNEFENVLRLAIPRKAGYRITQGRIPREYNENKVNCDQWEDSIQTITTKNLDTNTYETVVRMGECEHIIKLPNDTCITPETTTPETGTSDTQTSSTGSGTPETTTSGTGTSDTQTSSTASGTPETTTSGTGTSDTQTVSTGSGTPETTTSGTSTSDTQTASTGSGTPETTTSGTGTSDYQTTSTGSDTPETTTSGTGTSDTQTASTGSGTPETTTSGTSTSDTQTSSTGSGTPETTTSGTGTSDTKTASTGTTTSQPSNLFLYSNETTITGPPVTTEECFTANFTLTHEVEAWKKMIIEISANISASTTMLINCTHNKENLAKTKEYITKMSNLTETIRRQVDEWQKSPFQRQKRLFSGFSTNFDELRLIDTHAHQGEAVNCPVDLSSFAESFVEVDVALGFLGEDPSNPNLADQLFCTGNHLVDMAAKAMRGPKSRQEKEIEKANHAIVTKSIIDKVLKIVEKKEEENRNQRKSLEEELKELKAESNDIESNLIELQIELEQQEAGL